MTATLENTSAETYTEWGSLVTAVPSSKLDKKHSPNAQNVLTDEIPGALVSAPGYTKVGDLPSGNPCRFLYTFTKSDGTQIVLCSDNSTVYKTTDFVSYTSIITGLSVTFQLRAATLRDKVWFTNGNDDVRTYDGTTVVALNGTGGTPDVPTGKFIEVWHERVWIGDIPSNRSAVRFSALTDGSGNDIAPDHADAWPTDNEIHFGQDDGDVVTGLQVYLGRLHAFKSNSIWRVQGDDEFTYSPFRTTATTGSRMQESIQERDNLLEFIGKNGIYEFDGNSTRKVSEPIESLRLDQFSFLNIQQTSVHPKSKVWTSQADLSAGSLSGISATRVPGSLVIPTYTYNADSLPTAASPVWTRSAGGLAGGTAVESVSGGILTQTLTATNGHLYFINYTCSEIIPDSTDGVRLSLRLKLENVTTTARYFKAYLRFASAGAAKTCVLTIYKDRITVTGNGPGSTHSYSMDTTDDYHVYEVVQQGATVIVNVDSVQRISGAFAFGNDLPVSSTGTGLVLETYVAGSGGTETLTAKLDYVTLLGDDTNSYEAISDIYNVTDTITAWGAFQATYSSNGGSIVFYIRGATTQGAVSGQSWTAITPGSAIALPTNNNWVQWRAVFTAGANDTPRLDDVTINWTTGTASAPDQLVASVVHGDRYWLAAALQGSTYNDVVMMRGKRSFGSPWARLSGFNLLAFTVYNNELYAASSSSDDLYRLDTGNSLNGSAMDSYWETRDEMAGDDAEKRFPSVHISGQKLGNYSLTVDVSVDGGSTYPAANQRTISLSGSGRFSKELWYPTLRGRQCRVRVRTNGIDTPFEVHTIRIYWRKTNFR